MKQPLIRFLLLAATIIVLHAGSGLAAMAKGTIAGTILSAETNQPVAGAVVELDRIHPRKPAVKHQAGSDSHGTFAAQLPAGRYRYLVRRHGFGTLEGTVLLVAGETVKLPLPLNREAQVVGRIVDAAGKPLSGIKVSFGKYAADRTDAAGRFTVNALAGGWYELSIDHPSWVPEKQIAFSLAVEERKDAGDIVVRKGGTLVVHLRAGGRPVTRGEVSLSGNLAYRYGRTDQRGQLTFGKLPPGSYSLESYDERLMESHMNIDVPEGESRTVPLTAQLRPPSLSLDSPGRVILPGAAIPVSLRGLWVERAKISVYAVDAARLLDGTADPGNPATFPTAGLRRVLERDVMLKKARATYFRNGSLKLDSLPPGLYLVEAVGGKAVARSSFLVTSLGLVAKASPQGTLLFAVDLVDGRALNGVEIRAAAVSPGASAFPAVLGTTGADGLFACPDQTGNVRIVARKDANLAVFHVSAWQAGAEGLKGYLYTERPAYRPGQAVYFKGVLRKRVGEGYARAATAKVRVTVADSGDQTLLDRDYPVSPAGSFTGELVLPEQPSFGDYTIRAETAGHSFQTSFKVLEYRKPEFEVAAVSAKQFHIGGDPVPVSVTARYYFGAPVVDGRVRYRIYSRPYNRYGGDGDDNDDDDYRSDGYADFLGEGETVTDASGTALVTIETRPLELPRVYTVEFDVADAAGREVSASAAFTVTPSLIALSVHPLAYLCVPGKQAGIQIGSATWEGQPIPARISVAIEEQLYDRDSRSYTYRKLAEREVVTDEAGRAVFSQIFPRPGYWRVTATTTDARGLRAVGEGWLWVWRAGYAWDISYRELGVELDKKSYRPGEIARVIVKSPAVDASLLLTVEGRGIYSRRVVPAAGSVEVVEIPVTGDMAPYVFVSAVLIHKGHFYSRTRTLRVDSRPDLLDLKLTTDKAVYAPGDKVRLSVAALGNDSRPRDAELSVAVVDEALFAIAPEGQPDIYRFFRGTREHRVLTFNSFPRVYLGGAPKGGRAELADNKLQGIKVRKVFKDTAFWLPVVTTGADGSAETEFELPDNLTSWRATAIGFTEQGEFGTGRNTFLARLDVMARLQPPRFLTVGDKLSIPGIITNMTDREQSVSGIFAASGLSLSGDSRFSGIVSPGGTVRRDLAVKADSAGEALLRMQALTADRGDAMELTIPVLMRGMKRVSQGNIVLRGSDGEMMLALPEQAMAEGAVLDLSLAPTLTASLNESLKELIDFPYGCVEQTMSRFLPAVQVKKLLGSTGFSLAPEIADKLARVLDQGLRRLYDYQRPDGGWGWWKEGATDPYLTAHVMYGLALARTAGVPVQSDRFEMGIQSLSAQMEKASLEALPALYRAYVLTGRSAAAVEQRIEAGWRQLLPSQRVQYLAGLLSSTRKERAVLLLEELKKGLKREGASAWLKDDDAESWWYSWRWSGSAVETTALLLECQLAVDPEDPLVSSLAEFLVRKRSGRWWNTTRGTATVVTALAHYAAATGELEASYTARLFLNGRQLDQYVVRQGRFVQGRPSFSIPMKELQRGENRVRLERDASAGALYLSALLGYFVPPEAAGNSPGLAVERRVYRLVPRRNGDQWRMEYVPLQPGEKLAPGDDVEVRLIVDNKEDMNFVIIEDRLPAGFEVRETRDDPRFAAYSSYWDWYAHRERHDERMAFFLDLLPAGRHEFRYVLYPELTGDMLALPAAVWPMYVPSHRSESELWQVRVEKGGAGR